MRFRPPSFHYVHPVRPRSRAVYYRSPRSGDLSASVVPLLSGPSDDIVLHELRTGAACITFCDTLGDMTEAISVRLDDEAEQALRTLDAAGMSRSEAIRTALVRAAHAMRRDHELSAEVAALEADDEDRSEMLAVAQLMESLRAPG